MNTLITVMTRRCRRKNPTCVVEAPVPGVLRILRAEAAEARLPAAFAHPFRGRLAQPPLQPLDFPPATAARKFVGWRGFPSGTIRHRSRGFTLVEVTLALGLLAFALVAIYGLLPVGLLSSRTSARATSGADAMMLVVADLRAAGSGAAVSPRYGLSTSEGGTLYFDEGGNGSPTLQTGSQFRVVVALTPGPAPKATTGSVAVTWPAPATAANAEGSMQTFLALPSQL